MKPARASVVFGTAFASVFTALWGYKLLVLDSGLPALKTISQGVVVGAGLGVPSSLLYWGGSVLGRAAHRWGWVIFHGFCLAVIFYAVGKSGEGLVASLACLLALSFVCGTSFLADRIAGEDGGPHGEGHRLSDMAIVALLLSGGGFLFMIIGSVPGIVLGHTAIRRCKSDPHLSGVWLARAALVIAYLGLLYSAFELATMYWVIHHDES